MKNRIKSLLIVYRPLISIAATVILMIVVGGICGYGLGRSEGKQDLQTLRTMHLDEIKRMQSSHQYVVGYLTEQISDLADKQSLSARRLTEASKKVDAAASKASKAAQQRAQSRTQERSNGTVKKDSETKTDFERWGNGPWHSQN